MKRKRKKGREKRNTNRKEERFSLYGLLKPIFNDMLGGFISYLSYLLLFPLMCMYINSTFIYHFHLRGYECLRCRRCRLMELYMVKLE